MSGDMAPWDELRYFSTPQVSTVSVPAGSPKQIFSGDPQCVLLIFSNVGVSGTIWLSISSVVTANTGLQLQGSTVPFVVDKFTFGSLTTVPWFAAGSGAGPAVSVTSLSLKEWPQIMQEDVDAGSLQRAINTLSRVLQMYGREEQNEQ